MVVVCRAVDCGSVARTNGCRQSRTFRSANRWLFALGYLPLVAAALWLGRAPAVIVGLTTGLSSALFGTHLVTQPLEIALVAFFAATLMDQHYQGRGVWVLRQPMVAALLSGVLVGWPLAALGIFSDSGPMLARTELSLAALPALLISQIVMAAVAGGLVQLIAFTQPEDTPPTLEIPPWRRRLGQRIILTTIPLITAAIVILVGTVGFVSYRVATNLVISQLARDANNASSDIPFFIQMGRSLSRDLAGDENLANVDSVTNTQLARGMRALPFFQELAILNDSLEVMASFPAEGEAFALTSEETTRVQLAVDDGLPSDVTSYIGDAESEIVVSFIAPVSATEDSTGGALVGRTTLDVNPTLTPMTELLAESFAGSGEGFLLDAQGRILLYPSHPDQQGTIFELGEAVELASEGAGQAFRMQEVDGTRQLVYLHPVTGQTGWSVALTVPNEVALRLAAQIALPLLLLLLVMAAAGIGMVLMATRSITSPLEQLLQAVDDIGEGQLDVPLMISSEDEIGRLEQGFEIMRLRLRSRLDELERLLRVTRSVASSLELFRAMPPILNSALEVTGAIGIRMVVRGADGSPGESYSAGDAGAIMVPLDDQIMDLVEQQGTVVISQLWRAAGSLDTTALPQRVKALVALPLRGDTSFHGIFWLIYDHEHMFEQSEMTFLSTLAGQAAVAVSNARLFTEIEAERRKLQTVVESTPDAMIVADRDGQIILINPVAEHYLDLRREHAEGRRADKVIKTPELAELLTDLQEPISTLELPGPDGLTLLANTSTIVGLDGTIAGRVTVMRDITALKELDNIKTVFLRMVSHDLRSPLTYMRGFLQFLPLAGDLNDKQNEALDKVNDGIDKIADLTDRLLYLSRIQFGDEAELEITLVDIETMIRDVEEEQESLAETREVSMRIEAEETLPLVAADELLVRQAVANLVNNALKYTPTGGEVVVKAAQVSNGGSETVSVAVSDTGVGIRPEDQDRLFEAFYRVPQREGEPSRPKGTGLGLALVKAIVKAHGGDVEVESQHGQGSTFTIILPVRDIADL